MTATETIWCEAADCTQRGEHLTTCTNPTCTGCWPRKAIHGYLCQRHYDRVDTAIQVAHRLEHALHNIEHAIRLDPTNTTIAGPRVPLTAWQLDLDAIHRADTNPGNLDTWISTIQGANDALTYARLTHHAEQRHPLTEQARKLHRLRCPNCNRLTATWQPPDWYGDNVTIACIDPNCGWEATNPDALTIAADIEAKGHLDDSTLYQLAQKARNKATRNKGAA